MLDEKRTYVVYPAKPNIVGINQTNLQSPDRKFIVRKMIERSKAEKQGFITYQWVNPHHRKTDLFQKSPKMRMDYRDMHLQ